ncbi:LIC_12616 family protein, partial [Lysinibacillus sp. D4B2_S17]|uniref:phage neck terminator protein n=1 Tax=Lysinibacillus sp. D4B2_S17 TaxID=2941225 RepID=UPI0037CA2610
ESFDKALEALEWFKGVGVYVHDESNIVVVDTQPITNRDTFTNIDYERRHGFDVRLRVMSETTFNVGYIEHDS